MDEAQLDPGGQRVEVRRSQQTHQLLQERANGLQTAALFCPRRGCRELIKHHGVANTSKFTLRGRKAAKPARRTQTFIAHARDDLADPGCQYWKRKVPKYPCLGW